jgi:2'-5' RNA ligase
MRLFIGLPVPPELARALVRFTQSMEIPKTPLTPPENIHLTLVFLGEVAELTVPLIDRELSELTFAPFHLQLTGLSTFQRAGVLFAEIEPARALLQLQARVAASMARCGFAPEDRPYHPHLTLARFRGPLRRKVSVLPASLQRGFPVDAVNLYRSSLSPNGSHYEVLVRRSATRSE